MNQSNEQSVLTGDKRMNQQAIKRSWKTRRQPVGKTIKEIMVRAWVRSMIKLSTIAPVCLRLAELPLGPYKDRKAIFRYLGDRPYISTLAQVSCANLQMGPQCFIDDYVTIYAHPQSKGSVHLAENVHIYRWTVIELGDSSGSLSIGENTYIQAGCTLNPFISNITIGANCMIATRCIFMPYQHGHADTSRPMREQALTSRGDIVIEDDVWLGAHVTVMDGVVIGKGAIVGAGAVVTKDVPPYTLAAGVPARVLRERHQEPPSSLLMELPAYGPERSQLSQDLH